MKPRFYLRVINMTFILFPSCVNWCLVFDGWKIPYLCHAHEIINDLSFKEFKI
jgi:hypothetical protein